ncbi:MAG: outer membrane protein assembly factor, partial [Azoarcus sp.]|nr:outer membrane protein assembly factor [Azoarcus sp.]
MRVHSVFLRRLAVALICAASSAFAQPAPADETPLQVTLEAPEGVRALLERHLRILRVEQAAPERAADRVALLRRTRRDVEQLLSTEGYFSPVVRF